MQSLANALGHPLGNRPAPERHIIATGVEAKEAREGILAQAALGPQYLNLLCGVARSAHGPPSGTEESMDVFCRTPRPITSTTYRIDDKRLSIITMIIAVSRLSTVHTENLAAQLREEAQAFLPCDESMCSCSSAHESTCRHSSLSFYRLGRPLAGGADGEAIYGRTAHTDTVSGERWC